MSDIPDPDRVERLRIQQMIDDILNKRATTALHSKQLGTEDKKIEMEEKKFRLENRRFMLQVVGTIIAATAALTALLNIPWARWFQ